MFCPSGDDASLSRLMSVALWTISVPLVAFLYALLVWATYAFYRETSWAHPAALRALLFRWILMTLAWIVSAGVVALCGTCGADPSQQGIGCLVGVTAVCTVVFGGAGVKLILQTRREEVVGVDEIPFYGTRALADKLVVVTGSSNGIGLETARQLAAQGATILMLCRSSDRTRAAIDAIVKRQADLHEKDPARHPTPIISPDQLVFVPFDLTSFDSIRRSVKDVRQHAERHPSGVVDSLVLNAGLMMGTQSTTEDGFETMMQANHLGHFLLMKLLLQRGLLRTTGSVAGDPASEPSRVVFLTSSTHEYAATTTGFDFADPFCAKGQRSYTLFGQYSMTKLANLLTARELARRYNSGGTPIDASNAALVVFAVHPGLVRTNVVSNLPLLYRMANRAFGWIVASFSKTPEEGAFSSVYAVATPLSRIPFSPLKGSYVVNCAERETTAYVDGPTGSLDATRLWEWSADIVSTSLSGRREQPYQRPDSPGEKKEQ